MLAERLIACALAQVLRFNIVPFGAQGVVVAYALLNGMPR